MLENIFYFFKVTFSKIFVHFWCIVGRANNSWEVNLFVKIQKKIFWMRSQISKFKTGKIPTWRFLKESTAFLPPLTNFAYFSCQFVFCAIQGSGLPPEEGRNSSFPWEAAAPAPRGEGNPCRPSSAGTQWSREGSECLGFASPLVRSRQWAAGLGDKRESETNLLQLRSLNNWRQSWK